MDFQKYLEKKKEGSTKVIEYDGEQWTIRKVSPLVLLKFEIFPEFVQFSGGELKKEIEFSLSKKTMEFISIIIHSGLIDPKLKFLKSKNGWKPILKDASIFSLKLSLFPKSEM